MNYQIGIDEIPFARIHNALARGNKRVLLVPGGGLGDKICAEPAFRHAILANPLVKFCIATDTPILYEHLTFDEWFDFDQKKAMSHDFLVAEAHPQNQIFNQFIAAGVFSGVDFASIAVVRQVLKDKRILCMMNRPTVKNGMVLVHPGLGWESRTFPVHFYDDIIGKLIAKGEYVGIIGGKDRTLPVDPRTAVDLRGSSLEELMTLCIGAKAVITNDSSPIHAAAPGDAKIAYIPTLKRPDLLLHQRAGGWGWRMRSFNGLGMWKHFDKFPCTLDALDSSRLPEGTRIEEFLPSTEEVVEWVCRSEH